MLTHLRLRFIIPAIGWLCLTAAGFAAPPLTIVTTTPVAKSLAEAIGGDRVKVTSLGAGDEDPHFIQAKPSYMVLARNADLWIRIGMELEIGYEGLIIDGSRNPRIAIGKDGHLDLSETVIKLDVPTEKITRDMGDVHAQGNPHYWLDPLNGRLMAQAIAARLTKLAPADAAVFQRNTKAFELALDEQMFGKELVAQAGGDMLWARLLKNQLNQYLDDSKSRGKLGGWLGRMSAVAQKQLVTQHKSWIYFTHRFGLDVVGELEAKPGVPPSPAHLARVAEHMSKQQIGLILLEPFYERKAADWVAGKTGAKVLVCANSVGGQREATDYLSLLEHVVTVVSGGLNPAPQTGK